MMMAVEPVLSPHIARQTLCLAGSLPGVATHAGEDEFTARLPQLYQPDENNIAERLVIFKQQLANLHGEEFWARLMEGMTEICHAQFAFVFKRILVDDHAAVVEMPKIGEPGSCMMAVALYYNDGQFTTGFQRDYKYHAWSCPCAHMKHDKVFLVADNLSKFIPDNPNSLPLQPEGYLAVPLFANGKCYAHFGMMWTEEGLKKKQALSWAYIEMFLHSLEDMISARLLAGQGFAKENNDAVEDNAKLIPQSAVMATQSLKLYARSLSHELRTPMQGVVGMLDLMYATVQEQLEGQSNEKIRQVFQLFKSNIEVVQDSSKRAVEAADNVVQAYDLNMQVPATPTMEYETSMGTATGSYFDVKPTMTDAQIINPNKRKRDSASISKAEPPAKLRHIMTEPRINTSPPRSPFDNSIDYEATSPKRKAPPVWRPNPPPRTISMPAVPGSIIEADLGPTTPGFHESNIRESLPIIITDSLRVGGRPDFAVTDPIPLGERIEVKTRNSNGYSSSKLVTWTVDPDVPYVLPIDERDLSKLVGAVFLNALKFTDQGKIDVRVRLSSNQKYVLINVKDTGAGIALAFQSELFKAFSKEDDKITRTTEGLGLGLMVAKGVARKIGGDLHLIRSVVDGPNHGSEFEMRFPLEACDLYSRASTPVKSLTEGSIPRSIPTWTASGDTTPVVKTPPPIDTPSYVHNSKTNGQHTERREKSPIIVSPRPVRISAPPIIELRPSKTPKPPAKYDRQLALKYPLTFLVAEDNKINRKLLVAMLNQLGYKDVHEAHDGKEAVRVMQKLTKERSNYDMRHTNTHTSIQSPVDVILMDLWMPELDGYGATEQIFAMFKNHQIVDGAAKNPANSPPTILAISADVTDDAIDRATKIGMSGYMSKPFKVMDLQKLILEFCIGRCETCCATAA